LGGKCLKKHIWGFSGLGLGMGLIVLFVDCSNFHVGRPAGGTAERVGK